MYNHIEIIAEVKTKSPFGYKSEESWDELFVLAEEIGIMISVHTDARWGGSFELLEKARKMTRKPILAKGIHESDDEVRRALELGADRVLVVGRIPEFAVDRCMIEPLTLNELRIMPQQIQAVWNSRDLSDGGLKKETFAEARTLFAGWLCQASNIRTTEDIQKGADAVLVGTHLRSFANSLR
jgi:indole-3-glycerol phosphate synthase